MKNTEDKKTVRRSYIVTFSNHPPILLHGEFDAEEIAAKKAQRNYAPGDRLGDYEDGCLWDSRRQWGHHTIDYYVCKSGKRIYWASYNCGETHNGREPRTRRTFLKTAADIKNYLCDAGGESEWNRVGHNVDPSVIVDSDLL